MTIRSTIDEKVQICRAGDSHMILGESCLTTQNNMCKFDSLQHKEKSKERGVENKALETRRQRVEKGARIQFFKKDENLWYKRIRLIS